MVTPFIKPFLETLMNNNLYEFLPTIFIITKDIVYLIDTMATGIS